MSRGSHHLYDLLCFYLSTAVLLILIYGVKEAGSESVQTHIKDK